MMGTNGSIPLAVDIEDGSIPAGCDLKHAPVWGGMIAANRRLYVGTLDGSVICMQGDNDSPDTR